MPNEQLLKKYFSGQCSPEEEQQVYHYLVDDTIDHAALHALLDQAAVDKEAPLKNLGPQRTRRLLNRLRNRLYTPLAITKRATIYTKLWYSGAAAAVLLLAVMGYWRIGQGNRAAAKRGTSQVRAVLSTRTWKRLYNNSVAARQAVMPDGTRIWLNSYSAITYPSDYGVRLREVKLEGEAFFDVVTDTLHRFIVYHDAIATNVAGTAFNIEAYAGESTVRVFLVRGKVIVQPADVHSLLKKNLVLQPGQLMSYGKASGKTQIKIMPVNEEAWKNGYLAFNDVPLEDALQRVAHRFSITVQADSRQLKGKSVTGTFKREMPEQILHNLLFVHGLHFRKKKDGTIEVL